MISVVGTNSAGTATGSTSHSLTMPSGIADGDLGYLFITQNGSMNFSSSPSASGWTQVGSTQTSSTTLRGTLWSKTMAASDSSSSVSWTFSGTQRCMREVIILRGGAHDNVAGSSDASANTGLSVPSLTPVANGCLLLSFAGARNDSGTATVTPDSDYSEVIDVNDGSAATVWFNIYLATRQLVRQGGATVSGDSHTSTRSSTDVEYVVSVRPYFVGWGSRV